MKAGYWFVIYSILFILFISLTVTYFIERSNPDSVVCYQRVGCYDSSGDWQDYTRRPYQPLPDAPEYMNLHYILLNRQNITNRKTYDIIYDKDLNYGLENTDFKPELNTVIVTHGWQSGCDRTWIQNLTSELLLFANQNVICFDWSKGASEAYPKATSNIRVAAHILHLFIKKGLFQKGQNASQIHLIGHSLGAHLSGYAGKLLKDTKLARITGLDPAGPYFEGMPNSTKLYLTDADFVDVIHTNGQSKMKGGLGIKEPLGHIEFYINGGQCQPECGCGIKQNRCNHNRAHGIFTETINNNNSYAMSECKTYKNCRNNINYEYCDVNHTCAAMGYHSKKIMESNGTVCYLVTTSSELPPPPNSAVKNQISNVIPVLYYVLVLTYTVYSQCFNK